jgi:TRAP-type C4-dicarboxylate transport system substrate-binding protein
MLILLWTSPVPAQTLKIATVAPEGSSWMKEMRAGANEIEVLTKSRVKFKFYGGGIQGNEKQVQRKMRIGQLHGGAFTANGLVGFQKDAALFSMPMIFSDMGEVTYVRERMDTGLRQRLEDAGYINFGFAGGGFAYLMSNEPINNFDAVKGHKTWLPEGDEVSYAAMKALGVAPVMMPLTDVLTGLQTGLLDSASISPVGALVLQWHTRLRYITKLPLVYTYGSLVIQKKAFSRLSEEDQAVVRMVMEKVYQGFDKLSVEDDKGATQALLDSGLVFVEPLSDRVQGWRDTVTTSNRDIAAQGVFSAELLSELEAHVADYRASQADSFQ